MARKRKGVRANLPTLSPLGEAWRTFRGPLILTALIVVAFAVLSQRVDGSLLRLIGELWLVLSVSLSIFFFRKWDAFRMKMEDELVSDYGSESCRYRQKERQREKYLRQLHRAHGLDKQRISGGTTRNAAPQTNG